MELAPRPAAVYTKSTLPLHEHFPTVDELMWRYGQRSFEVDSGYETSEESAEETFGKTTTSIALATSRTYAAKLKSLETFLANYLTPKERNLHPTILMKKFALLRVESSDIVIRTLLSDLCNIGCGTTHYGYRITWDMKQVKAYIRNKLARVADYRCKLDKPLRLKQWAEPKVVNMFIKYLWTEDTYWYRDQGVRLHLHLVIALLSATGVRPSSILRDGRQYEFDPVEDIAYQKSKLRT